MGSSTNPLSQDNKAKQGTIHGIWFVQPNGNLHKAVLPNLLSWAGDAASVGYEVILWTNLNELAPQEKEQLRLLKTITVKDHSECKNSVLYNHFLSFLDKGVKGDVTAFALASDILRMAILELASDNEIFIYADPNDTKIELLNFQLKQLREKLSKNPLGYSFYAGIDFYNDKPFVHLRNDVLIALKSVNPEFFKKFIAAYLNNLNETSIEYKKPTSGAQAQKFANLITFQIGVKFFINTPIINGEFKIVPRFLKDTIIARQFIHSKNYLFYTRMEQNSNTWLSSDFADEEEKQIDVLTSGNFEKSVMPIHSERSGDRVSTVSSSSFLNDQKVRNSSDTSTSSFLSERKAMNSSDTSPPSYLTGDQGKLEIEINSEIKLVFKPVENNELKKNEFILGIETNGKVGNGDEVYFANQEYIAKTKKFFELKNLDGVIGILKDLGETSTQIASKITSIRNKRMSP